MTSKALMWLGIVLLGLAMPGVFLPIFAPTEVARWKKALRISAIVLGIPGAALVFLAFLRA